MQVIFLPHLSDHHSVRWEVRDDKNWWSVVWSVVAGGWSVYLGSTGRELSRAGTTYRRIIAAVEAVR